MRSTPFLSILGLAGLAATAMAQKIAPLVLPAPGRACGGGLKIAPCPDYQECQPVSDTCTDLNRCRGVCQDKPPVPILIPIGRPCGSRLPSCPESQFCQPTSDTCTDVIRCRGTCQAKKPVVPWTFPGSRCSPRLANCPEDQECQVAPGSCANQFRCFGTCVFKNQYPSCGGFRIEPPPPCRRGTSCQDDPREPKTEFIIADKPGICIPVRSRPCSKGIAGLKCPPGLYCYDSQDGCNEKNGGRDCLGFCL